MINVSNEYKFNTNFKKYVDEYCKENNITVDEALNCEEVKRVCLYYTDV